MKEKEKIYQVIQKMIRDKKTIHKYIKDNGSIEGFKDNSITFAKPL